MYRTTLRKCFDLLDRKDQRKLGLMAVVQLFLSLLDLIGVALVGILATLAINGIQSEINQLIRRYSEEFMDLTFFMTGGDIHYFDFPDKNNIFVDENLTLKGLYQIYLFNAH